MIKQITREIYAIKFNNFGCIVYLITLPKENILIDTSSKQNSTELINSLKELNIKTEDITTIILTHGHYDHIENIGLFTNAKIYSHAKEPIMHGNKKIDFSKVQPITQLNIPGFTIYKTPGHTSEDIIILYKNILFSGDVVFHEGYIGRTDFPESSPEKMQESLKLIQKLKFDILCPGH